MDEYILDVIDSEIESNSENGQFIIDDDTKAEWAIAKIKQAKAENERIKIACENAIAAYEARIEKADNKLVQDTGYLEHMLRGYFEIVSKKVSKTQATYQLPSGSLKVKFGGISYTKDDSKLVAWLKTNADQFIKVTETPDWAGLKKSITVANGQVVDENGEIVDGVVAENKPDTFIVEV